MTKGSFTRDRRWDLRDDFDVLFAMQDVVNEFVENNFLQKKHNIIRDSFCFPGNHKTINDKNMEKLGLPSCGMQITTTGSGLNFDAPLNTYSEDLAASVI